MNYLGDFKSSATVDILFTTHAAAGGAVAPSTAFENADVIIYKDNSATQRTSVAGITMTSPFDSITGLHLLHIDLSDNTDAGFWAAGHDYKCVLSPDTETVDSQTVVAVIASFSIENRCVNWAQVVSPTATVALNSTTVGTVNAIGSGAIIAGSFGASSITNTAIATDAIGAAELAADAVAEIQSGLSTLTQANIRTAVGLASANLDTQLAAISAFIDTEVAAILAAVDTEVAAIKAQTDLIPASPAAVGSAMTLTAGERTSISTAVSARVYEGTLTLEQIVRIVLASAAGKLSGAATTTVHIRDNADSKDRILATVDSSGNRTSVTLDGS